MEISKILTNPNYILRKRAEEIPIKNIISEDIQKLIAAMQSALKNAKDGIGLAAPQIGHSVRLFLVSEEAEMIDRTSKKQEAGNKKQETRSKQQEAEEKDWKYHVFINPIIKKFSSKKVDMAEGCLSVPGIYGIVKRPEKINLEWRDECGKKHIRGFGKFFARVIQHETDHLDGILFIDKMHAEVSLDGIKNKL